LKRALAVSPWALEGTHVASSGTATSITVSRTNLTTFSQFAIGGNNAIVVAVATEYFRGSKIGGANYLNWKVNCSSSPSVQMTLERGSDGRNFKPIQDQNATAVRCQQEFNFTDNTPLSGMNYYRLKTVSPDGLVKYSVIVALLNRDKGFEFVSVAPNPVKNAATLTITTVKGGKMDIAVSDLNGKILLKQSITVIAGNNSVNMNFESLSAGTYQISGIGTDGEIKTTRFVKY